MSSKHALSSALLVTAILAAAPLAAHAQEATYDFTGTIISSDFSSVDAGMTIVGTYTINLANSNPNDSDNGIQTMQPWIRATVGGAFYGSSPTPTGSVFSSTATVGSLDYISPAPSAYGSASQIAGGSSFYSAYNTEFTSPSAFNESSFVINSSSAPFTAAGLPLFSAGAIGTGTIFYATGATSGGTNGFQYNLGPKLDYSITSLSTAPRTPAPEISAASAASGLTLLLGGLAVLRGRRRTAGAGSALSA